MTPTPEALLNKARNCLQVEIDAVTATANALDESFAGVLAAIERTVAAGRKLLFCGVGKNVFIAQKLAATFNSTGVPATFLDPIQALHGDLGVCGEGDLAFLMSNSGETDEMVDMLPLLSRFGVRTVALTSDAGSRLATGADLRLVYAVPREACPLNLAPTASTTAALALGDALAMVYLEVRGLTREDFARYHPAGSLGKSLLLRVSEVMRTGERMAVLAATATVQETIIAITQAKCGVAAVTEADGTLAGVFSDGDFRRLALGGGDFMNREISGVMTRNPKTIRAEALGIDALRMFEHFQFNDLIVVDDAGRPIGLLDGQDLPRLRIV